MLVLKPLRDSDELDELLDVDEVDDVDDVEPTEPAPDVTFGPMEEIVIAKIPEKRPRNIGSRTARDQLQSPKNKL